MKLRLLPKLNRNKGFNSSKLTEPSDFSANSKIVRKFNSNQTQKTIPFRNTSSSIKNRLLYIDNKNTINKKFNLTLTNDFFNYNKSKSKSLFSSSMTQSLNFFVKKNKKILAQEMINLSKQYLSLNNNSYSRDSNNDKKASYYKEISPSFNSSSKKMIYLLKSEKNNSKFRNSFINGINNISTNFRKKSKNTIPNKIKSNLNLSKDYKIVLNQRSRNIKVIGKIDKKNKKNSISKSKSKSKSRNKSNSVSLKGSKNSSKNNIIKIKKLPVTSKFNSSKTIEKVSKSEKKEKIKYNTYTIFPSKFKNNNNKIKLIKKKKEKDKNNNIYDSILKNRVFTNILKHPDLELLYNINRKKIIRMIKSQSKNNKLRFSLLDYQNNLINNCPKLKTENHLYTLHKGFQYLNDQNQTNESESLIDYINFIQLKELDVINQTNLYNQNLYFKFLELGLSPKKFNLRPEKIEYKDVLNNYK